MCDWWKGIYVSVPQSPFVKNVDNNAGYLIWYLWEQKDFIHTSHKTVLGIVSTAPMPRWLLKNLKQEKVTTYKISSRAEVFVYDVLLISFIIINFSGFLEITW